MLLARRRKVLFDFREDAAWTVPALANGGFESWTDPTTPAGWSSPSFCNQDSESHSGAYCCRLDVNGSNSYAGVQQGGLAVVAGVQYALRFYYRTTGAATVAYRVRETSPGSDYLQTDGSWSASAKDFTVPASSEWTLVEQLFVPDFTGTVEVNIKRQSAANESIFLDSVTIEGGAPSGFGISRWGGQQSYVSRGPDGLRLNIIDGDGLSVKYTALPHLAGARTTAQVRRKSTSAGQGGIYFEIRDGADYLQDDGTWDTPSNGVNLPTLTVADQIRSASVEYVPENNNPTGEIHMVREASATQTVTIESLEIHRHVPVIHALPPGRPRLVGAPSGKAMRRKALLDFKKDEAWDVPALSNPSFDDGLTGWTASPGTVASEHNGATVAEMPIEAGAFKSIFQILSGVVAGVEYPIRIRHAESKNGGANGILVRIQNTSTANYLQADGTWGATALWIGHAVSVGEFGDALPVIVPESSSDHRIEIARAWSSGDYSVYIDSVTIEGGIPVGFTRQSWDPSYWSRTIAGFTFNVVAGDNIFGDFRPFDMVAGKRYTVVAESFASEDAKNNHVTVRNAATGDYLQPDGTWDAAWAKRELNATENPKKTSVAFVAQDDGELRLTYERGASGDWSFTLASVEILAELDVVTPGPMGMWVPTGRADGVIEDIAGGNDMQPVTSLPTWVDSPYGVAARYLVSAKSAAANRPEYYGPCLTYIGVFTIPVSAATQGAESVLVNLGQSAPQYYAITIRDYHAIAGVRVIFRDELLGTRILTAPGSHTDGDTISVAAVVNGLSIELWVNGTRRDTGTLAAPLLVGDGTLEVCETDPTDAILFHTLGVWPRTIAPWEHALRAERPFIDVKV